MSTIPDLFDRLQYPMDPGYRDGDTSYEAAKAIKPSKVLLQKLVLDALAEHGPCTSHQLATHTRQSYASIQPRTTELVLDGKIEDSLLRRPTPSGRNSKVWKLKSQPTT